MKKEENIISQIEKEKADIKNELNKLHRDFQRYETAYFSHIDKDRDAHEANVFIPKSFEVIEKLVTHLTATEPKGKFVAQDIQSAEEMKLASVVTEYVKYQTRLPFQSMHLKWARSAKQFGIFGSVFALVKYVYETDSKGNTVKDTPTLQELYIYDCYPDPSATFISEMQYFIHDEYVSLDDLKASNVTVNGKNIYKNLEKLEDAIKGRPTASVSNDGRNKVNSLFQKDTTGVKGKILITRKYTKNKWYSYAPDFNILIENRENPCPELGLPVVGSFNTPYPNQLMGISELQPVRKLQEAINFLVNQRLDAIAFLNYPVLKARHGSRYFSAWKWSPGAILPVEDMNDIQQFAIADTGATSFQQAFTLLTENISSSLGMFDTVSKLETGDRTATEIRTIEGEQNARLRFKEAMLDDFVKQIMDKWVILTLKYTTANKMIRVVGADAIKSLTVSGFQDTQEYYKDSQMPKLIAEKDYGYLIVTPEDLRGRYDFVYEKGTMVANDNARAIADINVIMKTLIELEEVLNKQGKTANLEPLLMQLLGLLGIKNIDEVIKQADFPTLLNQQEPQVL